MKIEELKQKIESNTLDESFLIFVISDESSNIICDQYVDLICKNKKLTKKIIDNISDIEEQTFIIDTNLYILKTDEWNSELQHNNCIVVCKSCSLKNSIKFPKLEDWQIVDFVAPVLAGIDKQTVEDLLKRYQGNYRLFLSDIDKIKIFNSSEQQEVLDKMIEDRQFKYVSDKTPFDFTNAIVKRDITSIKSVLLDGDNIDITPMHIMTILINTFKNIVNIQMNPNCTPSSLGISDKQFFVIKKYNCGYYSTNKLIKIYKMLLNIEHKFKFEELDIEDIIDYMLVNILSGD